jgi:TPP-dependent pyruvate/acetoin dehydrogenase alpha subunit
MITPAVVSGLVSLIDAIDDIRKSMMERGEWTEAHEAAYRARINKQFQEPHWIPEKKETDK